MFGTEYWQLDGIYRLYAKTNIPIRITLHSCHMTSSQGMMGYFVCSMLFRTWPDVRERQRAAWVMMMCACVLAVCWTGSDQDQTAHLDEEEPNHHWTSHDYNHKSHGLQERAAFHKAFYVQCIIKIFIMYIVMHYVFPKIIVSKMHYDIWRFLLMHYTC